MKLGLLLASPPERPELAELHQLALKELKAGTDVYLYLVDDGVKTLDRPEIGELRKAGAKVFACAYGAKRRNIPWDSEKAVFSGLTALVDIIAACDDFKAFTPLGRSPEKRATSGAPGLPRTLVTITEDPHTSHRPAEAIRIAAGIGSWKKTDVDILLHGPATGILSPYADEWIDGENYEHYLPIIREWKRPVLITPDGLASDEVEDSETLHHRCTAAEVEALKAAATFFLPF